MKDLSPELIDVTSQGEPTDRTVAVSESEIFLASAQAQDSTVQELREVLKYTHTVETLIGTGGMGAVYKVKNLGLDRYEAVKLFSHEISEDNLMRFQREARALSRVSDGNVVSIYNVSVLPSGVPFILMEYINGSSLADILSTHHPLNPHWSIYMFCLICYGLDAAHRVHVIHRDIKPENIIIYQDGAGRDQAKLIDFGIAKDDSSVVVDGQFETRAGVHTGTPRYMSPEQFAGGPITVQSDIYSLGCLLFAMLTGAPPYAANSVLELAQLHSSGVIPPLPREFQHLYPVFEKALAKEPRQRYEKVTMMVDDLYRRHNSIRLRPPVLIPMDRNTVLTASRKPLPGLESYVKQFWLLSLLCLLFLSVACLTSSYYRAAAALTLVTFTHKRSRTVVTESLINSAVTGTDCLSEPNDFWCNSQVKPFNSVNFNVRKD
jgi:serine/threonine protein kinase